MSRRTTEITRTIRAHTLDQVVTVDGRKFPALHITLKRFADLCIIADSASTMVDGYPTKTPMASEPTATHRPPRQTGDPDEPDDEGPDTPAERAAMAHLTGHGYGRDEVLDARIEAERHLRAAADQLEQLGKTLDRVDKLRSTAPLLAEYCHVAKTLGLPFDAVWAVHVRTTFKGYLAEPWKEKRGVSRWVYDQVRKNHRLPTEAEMRVRLALELAVIDAPTTTIAKSPDLGKPIKGHELAVHAGGAEGGGYMARVTCACGWSHDTFDAATPIETHVALAAAIPHITKVRIEREAEASARKGDVVPA